MSDDQILEGQRRAESMLRSAAQARGALIQSVSWVRGGADAREFTRTLAVEALGQRLVEVIPMAQLKDLPADPDVASQFQARFESLLTRLSEVSHASQG